jgi:hypothetical protein
LLVPPSINIPGQGQLTRFAHQISVFFILPETKNISLERMEKIFGGLDFVEAGEQEQEPESAKMETEIVVIQTGNEIHNAATSHVEHVAATPDRSLA